MNSNKISSLQNPQVKDIVRLRSRSHRRKTGLMIIEGTKEIGRALANGFTPEKLFFCENQHENSELTQKCSNAGCEIIECSEPVFTKISCRAGTGHLLALATIPDNKISMLDPSTTSLVLTAESIEKPGNLGAMIRSADSAGADAFIVCDPNTDIWNPNTIRASIGTVFCMPVIEATSDEAIDWLKAHSFNICAAAPEADTLYTEVDMTRSTAIVLGTEHEGLTDKWMNAADTKLRIPMLGQSDSLNVSASATILLYEARRQRSTKKL